MAKTKKTPRGDATPVKNFGGTNNPVFMPTHYGPTQKLKQAKRLPSQQKGQNV